MQTINRLLGITENTITSITVGDMLKYIMKYLLHITGKWSIKLPVNFYYKKKKLSLRTNLTYKPS